MTTLPAPPSHSTPRSTSTPFTLIIIASLLIGFGVMMLFFGATYLQDAKLLAEAPGALWAFICGAPLAEGMAAPIVLLAGVASVLVAGGLLLRGASLGRALVVAIMLLSAAGAAGAGYVFGEANRADLQAPPPTIGHLNPPRAMPDFSLTNADGGVTKLSDLRGKAVLLFFGYTHCPDICPTSLSDMRAVKAALGPDANAVEFVFVSVDGSRDTPDLLKRYVGLFDPTFRGLTGPESAVRQIALEYGARFRANKAESASSYTVDHTADTYLLDADGRWRAAYAMGTPAEDVAREVRQVLD